MSFKRRREERDGAFSGSVAARAIIDIGSNTVRLVVYGGSMRAPRVLLNEKVTARLGRDIAKNATLAPEAIEIAMQGLRRFTLLLKDLGVSDVETVATAAVREASNGADLVAEIRELGLHPRILSGEEEAILSAHGVAGAFPGAEGIVADLGGGSLELVNLAKGDVSHPITLPLGALRLPDYRERADGSDSAMRAALEKDLAKGAKKRAKGAKLFLVGGTWRAMSVFAMQAQGHPLSDPHGLSLSAKRAMSLTKALGEETPESLKARERISTMRAERLPDAAILLQALLATLKPSRVVFSSWGLREGILHDSLAPEARAQDPLLAGVSTFAAGRGAPPTLAARMASWTLDAAPARDHGNERLRLAATMLSLASMQIEPNIRLPQAIDWALQKRWIAISGAERAMLAAAIAANGNALDLDERVRALASEAALDEAINWGLSVRLARRLGANSRRSLEMSRLVLEEDALVLRLAQSHAALASGPVEKDMKLLAGRLNLIPRVDIVADDALRN
ncbi:MAG: Ppx/GppA family phosphatase [Erythrobacter sp.]|uniref:Ppx/GppA phosphatase family protein n=1 Tax=Erythrobacter sp. TaxID=1042 RepID=UPI00263844D7|nr:Ppx/GppA family phosphatase [Erythrobacter sp.]MDJ0978612.1 Ppx/GppA family phosphatase [Erythrobacter sp.]